MINKTNFVILTTMIPALRALNAFNMVDESFIEDISSYLGIEDKQVIIDWLNDNILNNEDRYDRNYYMDMAYSHFVNEDGDDGYIIKDNSYTIMCKSINEKINVIDNMIDFYEKNELYEKCIKLVNIKNKLLENNKILKTK